MDTIVLAHQNVRKFVSQDNKIIEKSSKTCSSEICSKSLFIYDDLTYRCINYTALGVFYNYTKTYILITYHL